MKIDRITLNNFRIYHGENKLDFSTTTEKNIAIVSGNNGFGKTSLLTSLVWCLYGKLMTDVDERYKREVYESGGYKRFCEKTFNRKARSEREAKKRQILEAVHDDAVRLEVGKREMEKLDEFSVSLLLSDVYIPSIRCNEITITRTHNVESHEESLSILIDGRENELSRDVGPEIFINDFVLSREIAKFFFFDAEKIVSLAEVKSSAEKRNLSRAYTEVLGIRKYLDLKTNLENLRNRLKRSSATKTDLDRLNRLKEEHDQSQKLLSHYSQKISKLQEAIIEKKKDSDDYQEKLIREGSSITIDELNELKERKEFWAGEGKKLKNRLKDLMELAPFAIAANKFSQVKDQIEKEHAHQKAGVTNAFIDAKLNSISGQLKKKKKDLKLTGDTEKAIIELISRQLREKGDPDFKSLLDFSREEENRFHAIYDNLQNAYSSSFKQLAKDRKRQQSTYGMIINKLSSAESKEKDPVIQEVRKDKDDLDLEIRRLENELIELKAKRLSLQNDDASRAKQITELNSKIEVHELDKAKDELAEKLIGELEEFILSLKKKKKRSLEDRLQAEINRLMHKTHFVNKVDVIVEGDLIDIELYDARNEIINKDGLSMGERQLYATALLKSLVDESNIRFPIFIDSPLQKFDRKHSENVIKEFYPNVSDQVVLFPLLDGELTEKEYQWMLPQLSNVYLIENVDYDRSQFRSVQPANLFKTYHATTHVH